ncbi:MAG: hypothetical protein IJX62_08215 [Clostridia bacterium]|nr:hypothetical protein [Clostridia bacterium]
MKKRIKMIALVLVITLLLAFAGGYGGYRLYEYYFSPLPYLAFEINLAANCAGLAMQFGDEEVMDALRKKTKAFERLAVESLYEQTPMALVNCLRLCELLDASTQRDAIYQIFLERYYNEETDMFCLLPGRDNAMAWNIALIFVRDYPQILECDQFSLREGILRNAPECQLKPPTGEVADLYGSGGAMLECLYQLSLIDGMDYSYLIPSNAEEWYAAWEAYEPVGGYEKNYEGLGLVGVSLGKEEKRQYLQDIYNNCTVEHAAQISSGGCTYWAANLQYVDHTQNENFYNALRARVLELAKQMNFVRKSFIT